MNEDTLSLLRVEVRNVIYKKGWTALRQIQNGVIRAFFASKKDILGIGPTGCGKTEAIYLPTFSAMLDAPLPSIRLVCVSPLKSLINDQFLRLKSLAKDLEIPINRWHGDVPDHEKAATLKKPRGVLIITPESVEGFLMRRSSLIPELFRHLQWLVLDEVHSLLDSERGVHLRSLVSRIATLTGQHPRIIGLSATIGDVRAAQAFINPDNQDNVVVVEDGDDNRELRVALLAHLEPTKIGKNLVTVSPSAALDLVKSLPEAGLNKAAPLASVEIKSEDESRNAVDAILDDILRFGWSDSNLVFSNSRQLVERLHHQLNRTAEQMGLPSDVFMSHHGSLSKNVRESTEVRLKGGSPVTAIATSSLELGNDFASVSRVFQLFPPWSVSSAAQRKGRSGRKEGQPSITRLYTQDDSPVREATVSSLLYPQFLRGVATVLLMIRGQVEPSDGPKFHLSTLVHQTLSMLVEWGDRRAKQLYQALCVNGPFRLVDSKLFGDVLRSLKRRALIDQDSEGMIVLGKEGEKITGLRDFCAAFASRIEFTVRWKESAIGLLTQKEIPPQGQVIILNGRPWRVERVDFTNKVVHVSPAGAGALPKFIGEVGDLHTIIFQEMRRVIHGQEVPEFLDPSGRALLEAARITARKTGLLASDVLVGESTITWFPWIGTRGLKTLRLFAQFEQIKCVPEELCLNYSDISPERFEAHIKKVLSNEIPTENLAALMPMKEFEKFDEYLDEKILDRANANDRLDIESARQAAAKALEELAGRHSQGPVRNETGFYEREIANQSSDGPK